MYLQDVSQHFSQFGQVVGVRQVLWEDTGRKRGYGYVEMADSDQVRMELGLAASSPLEWIAF